MMYKYTYTTPKQFSNIIMNSDGKYLTGLWFENSKDSKKHNLSCEERILPIFQETIKWLDLYFSGKRPNFIPKYRMENLTPFRSEVLDIVKNIEYGDLLTYNDIATTIAQKRGIKKMSSQAVGGAVGSNPICIIIPCHRVIGSNNNLVGYGGGLKNKFELLKLEGIDISKYFIPKEA